MTPCECGLIPVNRPRSDGMSEIVCTGHIDRYRHDKTSREIVLLVAPDNCMAEEKWEKWRAEEEWREKKARFGQEIVQLQCPKCDFQMTQTRSLMGASRCFSCRGAVVPKSEVDRKLMRIRAQIVFKIMTVKSGLAPGEAQCLGGVPGLEELFDQERELIESVLGGRP